MKPSTAFVMLAAFVVGAVAGAGAQLLKWLVANISHLVVLGMNPAEWNLRLLFLPVVGVVAAACWQRYLIKRPVSHGVERLKRDLAARRPLLPLSLSISPIVTAAMTLGCGGSAGTEGPIAYASSAIGSNVAHRCGFTRQHIMMFAALGAGAGIASIFKAPIGGFFFTIEVIGLSMGVTQMIALGVACLSGGMTAWMLSGGTYDIAFPTISDFDFGGLPMVVFLGIACGAYSCYYNVVMNRVTQWLGQIRNHWVKNIVAGGAIGALVMLLPALYGEGYGVIGEVLSGHTAAMWAYGPLAHIACGEWAPVLVAALIITVKAWATASTTSGGGVAGDFAPAIFAGCIAGFFFASVLNLSLGLSLPAGNFAFYGMAAVLAGTARAPLMAIFLIVEMTGTYQLLMPVACAGGVSYLTTVALANIYAGRLTSRT